MEPVLQFLNPVSNPQKFAIKSSLIYLYICSLLLDKVVILSADSLAPRGVSLSRASLYDPQKNFNCLDGSKLIPFSFVNDDYCDCSDGSDEPGTSACSPRGSFFCPNIGHQPLNIPSSRVNDNICDCCDGSDEGPEISCQNTCEELGRAAREESERLTKLMREGYEKRLELSSRGKEFKREKEEERKKLEAERNVAENIKKEKEALKEIAEAPEKEALEKIKAEEDARKAKEAEEEKSKSDLDAENMFILLDSNGDGRITPDELKTRNMFDRNRDGQVSDEEAAFFLNMDTEMSKEDFMKTGWVLFKPLFMLEQGLFKGPDEVSDEELEIGYEPPSTKPPVGQPEEIPASNEEQEEPEEAEEEQGSQEEHGEEEEAEEEPEENEPTIRPPSSTPKYDEETQALIDAAQKARDEFNGADQSLRDITNKLEEVQSILELDFGEDDRFAPLLEQCFDFEDREYIYSLCPFKNSNQRGRNGGGEVNLGKWSDWAGEPRETNKYDAMLYDKGQSCWNGPNRSMRVLLICGVENKMVSVSEPSRCVYQAEFETPTACNKPQGGEGHIRDEL